MDSVRRVTKWGPQYAKDGTPRWAKGELDCVPGGMYDNFVFIHTLYYYSMYDIAKLLNKNPNARVTALVNYSPEQQGTLYGELKFNKFDGITTQTSPNGERYIHPDIDQWFQTSSFRGLTETVDSGIAWTTLGIGGPLYMITIARCDWDKARHKRYDPPETPCLKVTKDRTFLGLVRFNGKDVQLKITNLALAKELRHWMVFRNRADPQTFTDLCVTSRRLTSVDRVSGTRQHVVDEGLLQDHIIYAYLVDAPGELEVLDGVKLLHGNLLTDLAKSLRFEGDVRKISWSEILLGTFTGRKEKEAALSSRNERKGLGVFHHEPNTSGLIPTKRT